VCTPSVSLSDMILIIIFRFLFHFILCGI
jgi:hypothetical protein